MDRAGTRIGVRRVGRFASGAALAVGAVAALLVLAPALIGWERYAIVSGSMTGTYDKGSLVLDEVVPVADLRVGDVITYTPPAGDHLITHRIAWIGRDDAGQRIFRTKGDANPIADPWTFRLDQPEQARVRVGVPYAGYALSALGRRDVRMIVIALPALLIAGFSLSRLWRQLGAEAQRRALLLVLAAVGLAAGGVVSSGADFTAHSSSPTTIGAAADFNTVTVSLTALGTPLTGSVPLSATAASNRGIANVKFQYAPSGTTDWTDVCTDNSASYGCSWNTPAIADGTYDVRALATDNAGYTRESLQTARVVDNYTLSVTLDDPGAMSGSEALTATAANASGGIQYLRIQHRAPGTTTWTDLCSGTTNPRTCNLDTTALPEGNRELRAVVRDNAGHIAQTTPIARMVDNSPPVTTPSIPPQASGSVTVSAEATDTGSGIQSVTFQAFYMGQWVNVCVDTTAPYSCTTDSLGVPDGAYSVRVITTNNAGVSTTGATSTIVIDNLTPAGSDIAAGNGGTTQGRLESGDWIRFTWSEPMAPASFLGGWTGTGQAITVRVRNMGSNDEMHLYSGATQLNLVLSSTDLKLGGNFVSSDAEFNATMSQSGNAITVTLGSRNFGGLSTAAGGNMTWRPSSAAQDLGGRASATTQVAETGSDLDF